MGEVNCDGRSTREINAEIKQQIKHGATDILVRNPGARHNLGVAVLEPVAIRLEGSVGYYCAGLIDGPSFDIAGSAGWGLAESMMSGRVVVRRNAGNGAAAAIRGGTVVIHQDAAARLGVS
ncbi:MAG: glutamate synthase, partial [Acidobacteria bacterium]